ncbi:MAG TPA: hypothetical protein VGS22_23385 [Thermoanaerobaculia bacterium]|jgi:hypothetical protein|nr:hypothetical protein [Thermoanaerobaculia bacterium]
MSIERFHHALHGAVDTEPMLAKLRAITKIEDPALILAAGDESDLGGWADWSSSSRSIPGLS